MEFLSPDIIFILSKTEFQKSILCLGKQLSMFNPLYINGFFMMVQGCRVFIFKNIVFFCLKIFTLPYSVDPDEMPH